VMFVMVLVEGDCLYVWLLCVCLIVCSVLCRLCVVRIVLFCFWM
jgi:hypothetical protein